jgi:hypothetical protein
MHPVTPDGHKHAHRKPGHNFSPKQSVSGFTRLSPEYDNGLVLKIRLPEISDTAETFLVYSGRTLAIY